jgi:hypothetical protein
MCKPCFAGIAACLILQTVQTHAECESGGVANPAAVKVAASSLEYALGQPKLLDVEHAGELRQIPYVKVGSYAVFEGDIILGDANQLEFAAQSGPVKLELGTAVPPGEMAPFGYVARSVLSGAQKWTNNIVPYVIDPNLGSSDVILRSMQAWSSKVPKLKFTERTAANMDKYPNYVHFTTGLNPNACLSRGVGMMGGRQNVELVSGCGFGQIVHEIGHVIGLNHEQNRSDRNGHVRVKVANILRGYGGQFKQRPDSYKDAGTYDLDSIMHYEPNAFSCNGQPTIVPVDPLPPGIQLGQRDHVSAGDAAVMNSVYN